MSTVRELLKYMEHFRHMLYEEEHSVQLHEDSQAPICLLRHLARANRRSGFLLNGTMIQAMHCVLTTFIDWQIEEGVLQGHETPCHMIFHSIQTETVIIDTSTVILFNVIVD